MRRTVAWSSTTKILGEFLTSGRDMLVQSLRRDQKSGNSQEYSDRCPPQRDAGHNENKFHLLTAGPRLLRLFAAILTNLEPGSPLVVQRAGREPPAKFEMPSVENTIAPTGPARRRAGPQGKHLVRHDS